MSNLDFYRLNNLLPKYAGGSQSIRNTQQTVSGIAATGIELGGNAILPGLGTVVAGLGSSVTKGLQDENGLYKNQAAGFINDHLNPVAALSRVGTGFSDVFKGNWKDAAADFGLPGAGLLGGQTAQDRLRAAIEEEKKTRRQETNQAYFGAPDRSSLTATPYAAGTNATTNNGAGQKMINIEGQEVMFGPMGTDGKRKVLNWSPDGPSHEQGGMNVMAPEGAAVVTKADGMGEEAVRAFIKGEVFGDHSKVERIINKMPDDTEADPNVQEFAGGTSGVNAGGGYGGGPFPLNGLGPHLSKLSQALNSFQMQGAMGGAMNQVPGAGVPDVRGVGGQATVQQPLPAVSPTAMPNFATAQSSQLDMQKLLASTTTPAAPDPTQPIAVRPTVPDSQIPADLDLGLLGKKGATKKAEAIEALASNNRLEAIKDVVPQQGDGIDVGGEGFMSKLGGILNKENGEKAGSILNGIAQAGPALYNVVKGTFGSPEKVERRHVTAPQLVAPDLTAVERSINRSGLDMGLAQAQEFSGGNAANARANSGQAVNDYQARSAQAEAQQTAGRLQVFQQNALAQAQAQQTNLELDNRYDEQDAQARAAKEKTFQQGLTDVSNIAAAQQKAGQQKAQDEKYINAISAGTANFEMKKDDKGNWTFVPKNQPTTNSFEGTTPQQAMRQGTAAAGVGTAAAPTVTGQPAAAQPASAPAGGALPASAFPSAAASPGQPATAAATAKAAAATARGRTTTSARTVGTVLGKGRRNAAPTATSPGVPTLPPAGKPLGQRRRR